MSQTPERPPITPALSPAQSAPPQSALTKWLTEPQDLEETAALLEMIATHERLRGPSHDGRGTVEMVLREVGYALPKIEKNAPLWLWVQRMTMIRWGYFPAWLARPVIGNLFFLCDDGENPGYVGIIKKFHGIEKRGFYRLGGDGETEPITPIPVNRVMGYLAPPDGCLTCVQRQQVLRQE